MVRRLTRDLWRNFPKDRCRDFCVMGLGMFTAGEYDGKHTSTPQGKFFESIEKLRTTRPGDWLVRLREALEDDEHFQTVLRTLDDWEANP